MAFLSERSAEAAESAGRVRGTALSPVEMRAALADIIIANGLPINYVDQPGTRTFCNRLMRIADGSESAVSHTTLRSGTHTHTPPVTLFSPFPLHLHARTFRRRPGWASTGGRCPS